MSRVCGHERDFDPKHAQDFNEWWGILCHIIRVDDEDARADMLSNVKRVYRPFDDCECWRIELHNGSAYELILYWDRRNWTRRKVKALGEFRCSYTDENGVAVCTGWSMTCEDD